MKKNFLRLFGLTVFLLSSAVIVSCSSDDNSKNEITVKSEPGSVVLSSNVWITSKIVDNKGNNISLDKMPGAMYAGYAYYNTDGTFRIVDFKDGHKMYGLWSLTDNDTKRKLVVFNSLNEILFERSVDLVELNNKKFTYVISDATNPSIVYNVEHEPVTNHPEPKTPAQILASVEWKTTKVLDITNGVDKAIELDRTIAPASNFSGDAYYVNNNGKEYFPKNKDGKYSNGTFLITAYGDKAAVRSQGDWYVSLDGKTRTLIGRAADGSVTFERTVSVFELTNKKFTYDIEVGGILLRVEHEPIVR
ncbi:DUF4822 domain-containing protein [Myroides odoratimimus]|uniref:DUF4822 domain-containing protein n=1 Tax=Myroides odoratimimus TaxID=76832 RepID=UPI002575B8CE|nr:DUF4822 domain-containing protein [Myroides odoratimimus]MDM1398920.1 DUF4822 domain-containing protein [Myroides odoratimimus]